MVWDFLPQRLGVKVSFHTHTNKKSGNDTEVSMVNAAVGGSCVLSLPFLLPLWSWGVMLNFRLGIEPVLWLQPQPPDHRERKDIMWPSLNILWTGRSRVQAQSGDSRGEKKCVDRDGWGSVYGCVLFLSCVFPVFSQILGFFPPFS